MTFLFLTPKTITCLLGSGLLCPRFPQIELFELGTTRVTCDNAFNALFYRRGTNAGRLNGNNGQILVFEEVYWLL